MDAAFPPWAPEALEIGTFEGFVNRQRSAISTTKLAEWPTRYTLRWNCSSLKLLHLRAPRRSRAIAPRSFCVAKSGRQYCPYRESRSPRSFHQAAFTPSASHYYYTSHAHTEICPIGTRLLRAQLSRMAVPSHTMSSSARKAGRLLISV